MAAIEEIVGEQQKTIDNSSNGDSSLPNLEYSGTSEDGLISSTINNSIAQNIVQDFNEDLDEHVSPAPAIKAVKREIHDSQGLSDDEFPKTLITLETVKKSAQPAADDMEICPIETVDDDDEEEPVLLEVVNEDDEPLESDKINEKIKTEPVRRERKRNFSIITNKDKVQTPKSKIIKNDDNNEKFVTPNKPIPEPSAGTIEFPRELIVSDLDVSTPIIINHIKDTGTNNDDLIAILEGDDNGSINIASAVEHYELSLQKSNGDDRKSFSREEEREIAMEQMMNLPKKKKGRPKLKETDKRTARPIKKVHNADFMNSLVSDWSDNEHKIDDANEVETEIVVEINIPEKKKRKIVEPIQPTFRRSRIIKKKIIWDPDAPETAINYASLAHTSGAGPIKKPRKSITKKESSIDDIEIETEIEVIPGPPIAKKKKTSEIDKLLGDEGAANMLNSLNQGNNNNNTDGTSPNKMPRARQIKAEPCNVTNASIPITKTKQIKTKDVKDPTPQKVQPQSTTNKKNVAPKNATAAKKRGPKSSSESWDYIYKSRPDDCMIIRRRSNSSYSSTASINHPNMDGQLSDIDAGIEHDVELSAKRSRNSREKNFEFARPKATKGKKIGNIDQNIIDENVQKVFNNRKPLEIVQTEEFDVDRVPIKLENRNDKFSGFEQIVIEQFENFAQIALQTKNFGTKTVLTVQMMHEIETAFRSFEKDDTCKLILITSADDSFINGLDYSTLIQPTIEKKRAAACDLTKKLA